MGIKQSSCFENDYDLCFESKSKTVRKGYKDSSEINSHKSSDYKRRDTADESIYSQESNLTIQEDKFTAAMNDRVLELQRDSKFDTKSSCDTDRNDSKVNEEIIGMSFTLEIDMEKSRAASNSFILSPLVFTPSKYKSIIQSPTNNRLVETLEATMKDNIVLLENIIVSHNLQALLNFEKNCNIRLKDVVFVNDNSTPLHLAVQSKDAKIVEYILNSGVNIFAQNKDGLTALQLAYQINDYQIMEILLEASANGYDTSTINTASMNPAYVDKLVNDEDNKDNNNEKPNSPISEITCDDFHEVNNKSTIVESKVNNNVVKSEVKHKGLDRQIRKASSRVMSFIKPDQYPKSKRKLTN